MGELTYTVADMHCDHCKHAIGAEVGKLAGVDSVLVDLESKRVTVHGSALDDAAVRGAIEEAGYEAA
jgi:copper chaperone CopZ